MGAGGCRLCWGNRQTLPDGEGLLHLGVGGQSFLRVLSRVTTSGQGWGRLGLVRPGVGRPCYRRTEAWGPSPSGDRGPGASGTECGGVAAPAGRWRHCSA